MKEKIYTIPINEAFDQKSECPLCLCERKLENDALEYHLGPAMMEPDSRIETNRTGFCALHFTRLYNMQANRLALGLVIDTHMMEQNKALEELYKRYEPRIKKDLEKGLLESAVDSLKGKKGAGHELTGNLLKKLSELEKTCAVCDRIQNNMTRFLETVLYLYFKEEEFRQKFHNSQGFCLKHFKMLLESASKELGAVRQTAFLEGLMPLQLNNMKRVQEEVSHFTKMFDYRSANLDWKNSRDAVPRSIEKLSGPCDLMR